MLLTVTSVHCRVGEGCPSLLASLAKPLEPPQPGYRADLSKVTSHHTSDL